MNHHGFRLRLGRKVALVADTHDFAVQPERKQNLRSRRQQRDYPHDRRIYHIWGITLVSPIISNASPSVLVGRTVGCGLLTGFLCRCGADFFVGAREGFHHQLSTCRAGQSGLESVAGFGGTTQLQQKLTQEFVRRLLNGWRAEFEGHGVFLCDRAL